MWGTRRESEVSVWTTARSRGAAGRNVEVAVGADGSFVLGIDRGRRWLLTVDDVDGKSAIVTFGSGENVLRVSAAGGTGRGDIGGLQMVGGEAQSAARLDAKLGVEAALAGLDDVFAAANGAIVAAREAAAQARQAAEDARNKAGL